jgi:large subunit ribosomal protein L32e
VFNPAGLEGLSKDAHIVRIAGTVGKRKRVEIFKKAKKLGIKVVQNEPESSKKAGK